MLIAVAWIVSFFFQFEYFLKQKKTGASFLGSPGYTFTLGMWLSEGAAGVGYRWPGGQGWQIAKSSVITMEDTWLPFFDPSGQDARNWNGVPLVILPLWIPFLIVAIPTGVLWRRDRRIPQGHCQECGYSLTGNTSGVCPECGTAVNSPPASPECGERI